MVDRFEKFSLAISEISRYWHKIAAEELKPYELKSTHAIYLTTMYRYHRPPACRMLWQRQGRCFPDDVHYGIKGADY